MKALSLIALAVAVSANHLPINTQYIRFNNVSQACEVQPGYFFQTALSNSTQELFNLVVLPPNFTAGETNCYVAPSTGLWGRCSGSYTSTNPAAQVVAALNDAGTYAYLNTTTTATTVNPYNFATNVFTCTVPQCNVTCTGVGCPASSVIVNPGVSTFTVCNSGTFANPIVNCVGNESITVSCTTNPSGITTLAQYLLYVEAAGTGIAFSVPEGTCNCDVANPPDCDDDLGNANPTCACLSGCTGASTRQVTVNGAAVTVCLAAVTLNDVWRCLRSARCDGGIGPNDVCRIGLVVIPCPDCDRSKKGLLGLLGLLGLIPLCCCSLLCLLLLCCRRKKTGAPAHIGTFEQPAVAEVPLAHEHVTYHTSTHVGPAHVDYHGPGHVGAFGPTVF